MSENSPVGLLGTLIERMALDYHKTVEGEYGCGYPQTQCPGVLRLIQLLGSTVEAALATLPQPPVQGDWRGFRPSDPVVRAYGPPWTWNQGALPPAPPQGQEPTLSEDIERMSAIDAPWKHRPDPLADIDAIRRGRKPE